MEKIIGLIKSSFPDQHYLLFLIGVMVIAGVLKEKNYLLDIFRIIISRLKNKKMVLALISLIGGILPISGRVVVSAGLLSTIAPKGETARDETARQKYGIIDYLSTHHYYLWSPLEKTVILPMAALGLSWAGFMKYTLPLLVISLAYVLWYISFKIEEDEIEIAVSPEKVNWKRLVYGFLPFAGAVASAFFFERGSSFIMLGAAAYYIFLSRTSFKKAFSYINWPLVLLLGLIIVLAKFTGGYSKEIEEFIKSSSWLNLTTVTGVLALSSFAFIASWFMGSSGKFAGILAILVTIFGPQYLVWFFVLEFAGYNLSPMHKCVPIGKSYFHTPLATYMTVLTTWMLLLLGYAYFYTFVL
ncbi:MAG: hypothetical protein WCW77_01480 [Patescibacteria group bacterium]|jgi:hypothetical protein